MKHSIKLKCQITQMLIATFYYINLAQLYFFMFCYTKFLYFQLQSMVKHFFQIQRLSWINCVAFFVLGAFFFHSDKKPALRFRVIWRAFTLETVDRVDTIDQKISSLNDQIDLVRTGFNFTFSNFFTITLSMAIFLVN